MPSSNGSSSSSYKYLSYFVGTLLLIHSGYSAFEFHKYATHYNHHILHQQQQHQHQYQHQHQNQQQHSLQSISLPLDIYIEAIIGFIIVMVGALVSIENPVHLSITGEDKLVFDDSKYLRPIEMKDSLKLGDKVGINAFEELQSRVPFIDIVAKRKEYEGWVNEEKSKLES
ncbi:hypothetical protein KGF57_005174 [Candida theae]|uniref:Membrane magnesium transporter n=1 Tax=Candida theae TaxID=1198502 RepID=A0AAD5FWD5_9ASCO|nr:uncharacterized protein KGF57_005174 [Candida theae]KAI5948776.1 hypothetical protein KGF57_005174 [Candida theae]